MEVNWNKLKQININEIQYTYFEHHMKSMTLNTNPCTSIKNNKNKHASLNINTTYWNTLKTMKINATQWTLKSRKTKWNSTNLNHNTNRVNITWHLYTAMQTSEHQLQSIKHSWKSMTFNRHLWTTFQIYETQCKPMNVHTNQYKYM